MSNEVERKLGKDAKAIFYTGLEAVDPFKAVKGHIKKEGGYLRIGQKSYDLKKINRIFVVGLGKAAVPMARAVQEVLGENIFGGIVAVKYGHGGKLAKIKVKQASHPIPDQRGQQAAEKIIDLLERTGEDDFVICLISGGGSAILPAPVEHITLKEKQKVTQLLLDCGASIGEINTIRKHLSRLKGGRLAHLAFPSHLHSIILSDVVGDRLDTIASGPTVPDETSFEDCWGIIEKYNLSSSLPSSVAGYLKSGLQGKIQETPKPGHPIFEKVENLIVGSSILALRAAKKKAQRLGYACLILSSFIEGDTRQAADFHVALAKEIIHSANPVPSPACILSGGETTVKVTGKGVGGRNQEFCLAACIKMREVNNALVLSAGTDGTDGPTDAAGALVSGSTWQRAKNAGILPEDFLQNNDSYNFFKKMGGLFITGPTSTNVMDLRILLVR